MNWLRKVIGQSNDFFDVLEEASRLEEDHYRAQGWSKEHGKWTPPAGEKPAFDGPGSHVSIVAFIEPAARNLKIDISEWKSTVDRVRDWLGSRTGG